MKTKLLATFLALALTLALASCGHAPEGDPSALDLSDNGASPDSPVTPQVSDISPASSEEVTPAPSAPSADCTIVLSGEEASVSGQGAQADGGGVTISAAGSYRISGAGTLPISVDVAAREEVLLLLDGVSLSTSGAALRILSAPKRATISLPAGSVSSIEAVIPTGNDEDAAIYSKEDLVITGEGQLGINCEGGKGVVSKDDLTVEGGEIAVRSSDDGMRAKDSLTLSGGSLCLKSESDGLHCENDEDGSLGNIALRGGTLKVVAAEDGVQASGNLFIEMNEGSVDILTGGGSAANTTVHEDNFGAGGFGGGNRPGGGGGFRPGGGGFRPGGGAVPNDATGGGAATTASVSTDEVAPADDGTQQGGETSQDDGAAPADGTAPADEAAPPDLPNGATPADGTTPADGGTPPDNGGSPPDLPGGAVTEGDTGTSDEVSRKGMKAAGSLTAASGKITIDAYDDALHAGGDIALRGGSFALSSGDDAAHADGALEVSDGRIEITACYEGLEGRDITLSGGEISVSAEDDGVNASDGSGAGAGGFVAGGSSCSLSITGGSLTVSAEGDGLDANGNITQSGGSVLVYGPTREGNGALDYGEGCSYRISGGSLLAVGAAGMAEVAQNDGVPVLAARISGLAAGETLTIKSEAGEVILEQELPKACDHVVYASEKLASGARYTIAGESATAK